MVDLQPFRFKSERVPNPEDSGSEEVNDRFDGTFWCTCERCEIMRRECVCYRKQAEEGNKMAGRIFSIYCVGRSKWKDNFSLLIALDTKTQFNKAASSYILEG